MNHVPLFSGRQVVKVRQRIGYQWDYRRGSHIVVRHEHPPYRRLTIPDHAEVAKGTLRAIIRQAGLTVAEFKDLLKRA